MHHLLNVVIWRMVLLILVLVLLLNVLLDTKMTANRIKTSRKILSKRLTMYDDDHAMKYPQSVGKDPVQTK